MDRRDFLKSGGIKLAATSLFAEAGKKKGDRSNVVIIFADDLGYSDS